MKICQITASMDRSAGGPPNVISGSSLELIRKGCQVELCSMVLQGRIGEARSEWPALIEAGIVMNFFERDIEGLAYSLELENFLSDNFSRFDAFHFHGIWDLSLVISVRKLQSLGCNVYISAHGMLDPWSLSRSSLLKQLALKFFGIKSGLLKAKGVIFATQEEADLADRGLKCKLPAKIITNGVDTRIDLKDKREGRRFLESVVHDVERFGYVFLFCARLHPKKGLFEAVKAFHQIHADHPDWCFVIAGISEDLEYESAIVSYIADNNLLKSVFLTKEISGSSCSLAYAGSDALIQVSFQEGFSLTVLEAMLYGNPVVISDACHMDDVRTENCGRIVGNSIAEISKGMKDIMSMDKTAYDAMSKSANRLVTERFSWDRVSEQLRDVYRQNSALEKLP